MQEFWAVFKDTHYSISSIGNVRNDKTNKLLKLQLMRDRPSFTIVDSGKRKTFKVTKAMQTAFNLGEGMVSHVNGIIDDNRLENLIVVKSFHDRCYGVKYNSDVLLGAHFSKRDNVYMSKIVVKGKTINLGSYKTAIAAHNAYMFFKKVNNL